MGSPIKGPGSFGCAAHRHGCSRLEERWAFGVWSPSLPSFHHTTNLCVGLSVSPSLPPFLPHPFLLRSLSDSDMTLSRAVWEAEGDGVSSTDTASVIPFAKVMYKVHVCTKGVKCPLRTT